MQVVCGCSRCSGYLGYLAARVPTCVVMRLMSSMLLRLAVGQRLGLRARGRVLRRACGPWRQGHVCGGKGANRRNRPGHFHDVRPTAPTPASRGRGPGRVRSRGAEVRAVGGARRTGSGSELLEIEINSVDAHGVVEHHARPGQGEPPIPWRSRPARRSGRVKGGRRPSRNRRRRRPLTRSGGVRTVERRVAARRSRTRPSVRGVRRVRRALAGASAGRCRARARTAARQAPRSRRR